MGAHMAKLHAMDNVPKFTLLWKKAEAVLKEDNKVDAVDSKKELKTKIAANKWGPLGSKAKSQKQGQVLKLQKTFELAKIRKKRAVERTSKLAAKEAAVKHHL